MGPLTGIQPRKPRKKRFKWPEMRVFCDGAAGHDAKQPKTQFSDVGKGLRKCTLSPLELLGALQTAPQPGVGTGSWTLCSPQLATPSPQAVSTSLHVTLVKYRVTACPPGLKKRSHSLHVARHTSQARTHDLESPRNKLPLFKFRLTGRAPRLSEELIQLASHKLHVTGSLPCLRYSMTRF